MKDVFLTIVIPAYNEEQHILSSVQEVLRAVSTAKLKCEIIIVDDCSSDHTYEIASGLAENDPRITVLQNKTNLGLGGSYKAGLSLAKGSHITWVPADESHPAEGLISTYQVIGQADIIIPNPVNSEVRGWQRLYLSKTYTFLVNLFSWLKIPYYNGLSVHRTDLLGGIAITTNGFGFQAEIIVKLMCGGASSIVSEATIYERQLGESKAFTVKNILSVAAILGYILLFSVSHRFFKNDSFKSPPPILDAMKKE